MTCYITLERKNASVGSKIGSFWTKYLGDRSLLGLTLEGH